MARLWSSGFELNSLTAGVEVSLVFGTASIVTSPIRSGTYALRTNPTATFGAIEYNFASAGAGKLITYHRLYLRIASSIDTTGRVIIVESSFEDPLVLVNITSGNQLQLLDQVNSTQIGDLSTALSNNVWYRIELKVDMTTLASTSIEARLDGTSFASGTVNWTGEDSTGTGTVDIGPGGTKTCDIYFDDIAINDSTGSFQNSWPGEGEIIHLRPNATGDNSAWTGDNTDIDDTPAALASDDTINVVQVGVRFNGAGASANASFVTRIKKASAGTVAESSAITPSNTTWDTNADAVPRNYALTRYQDPDNVNWTKATLDSTQIGVRLSSASTNAAQVSTLWLLVDHKPAEAAAGYGPVFISNRDLLGVGV